MTRTSARIRTSEPAFKPHTSQWQRDRMTGVIQPMDAPCSRGEHPLVSLALWVAIIAAAAVSWAVLA